MKFSLNQIREIFAKMTKEFRQKFSRISIYFRPHFRENFRSKSKMIFDIYRKYMQKNLTSNFCYNFFRYKDIDLIFGDYLLICLDYLCSKFHECAVQTEV